jgi:hypothetical protein
MDELAQGFVRALCFHTAWGYAPTRIELLTSWDGGSKGMVELPEEGRCMQAFEGLLATKHLVERRGRIIFPGYESLVEDHEGRELFFPRKLRKARRVARWLSHIEGVRCVALCNTTALAHARDGGDLDFFVITKPGTIWQTRAWASLPFKLFGDRPTEHDEKQDAVCLSFFADEEVLDLSSLLLSGDDPYFRHWFLALLPLYDQGVMDSLWAMNTVLRQRHPFAVPWMMNPPIQCPKPSLKIPCPTTFERSARSLQERAFPENLRSKMNQGSGVVVTDHLLKFHVEDGRERFRTRYQELCKHYAIDP